MALTVRHNRRTTNHHRSYHGRHMLSREQQHALFARAVRANLGISPEEFLCRYRAGEYDGIDDPKLMNVLILRQFAE